jgi:hypothetical protein
VSFRERLTHKRLVPALAALDRLRIQLLDHLVVVGRHARIGQQEVEDRVCRQLRIPGQLLRSVFVPELAGLGAACGACRKLVHPVDLAPGADQRVAAHQLLAEPGHKRPSLLWREDAVEPKAHLRQLHRHRVEVNAEHVLIGQAHLHLLQLGGELLVGDALASFLLAQLQIFLRQLVHHLVQERRRAHRRLADLQLQDVGRGFTRQQLFQGVLHQALGE